MLKKLRENLTNPPPVQQAANQDTLISKEMLDKARANQATKLFNTNECGFDDIHNVN